MNKLLLCLLFFNFLTMSCADKDEQPANGVAQLENDFIAFITSLVQNPEINSVSALINHLLNMGFDPDSPAIEMLEDIQQDDQQRQRGTILTSPEISALKLQLKMKPKNG